MASNDERAKAPPEPPHPSTFIFDPPSPIPLADLLSPIMVKVTVWNKADDPNGIERTTFEIMRGMICAKSGYFEKAFKGKFKEALIGEVTLDGVSPWIFKIFLTWLYSGLVYIDHGDGTLQSVVCKKRKRAESVDPGSLGPHKNAETQHEGPNPELQAQIQALYHVSPDEVAETDKDRGYCGFSFGQEDDFKSRYSHHAKTGAPDEKDPSNPVTWPWHWLFDMYVFADQYDTRALREQTMCFIQLRLDMRWPRMYPYPDHRDTQRCVDYLPSSSPLRRLLVDLWANSIQLGTRVDPKVESQAKAMELLPRSFLIECFIAVKGEIATRDCHVKMCSFSGHDHGWSFRIQKTDRCRYHEHGEVVHEKAACIRRWIAMEGPYCLTEQDWE